MFSSWIFTRLVSAPMELYRHQIKTHGSYPIGLDFDLDMGGLKRALRGPKRETCQVSSPKITKNHKKSSKIIKITKNSIPKISFLL